MNDSTNKMTRRDWFRLRKPARNPLLGNEVDGEHPTELKPLESPPNLIGMDLSQLPPMREAVLSIDQLNLLFGDIERQGTDVHLFQRSRGGAKNVATDNAASLLKAKAAILEGSANKIQIRYRWNGSLWIDTLEKMAEGFRLIRIAHSGF